ncbi:MAG: hypothetical protein R2697_11510 [Ilumatobacteraceae bacterium]
MVKAFAERGADVVIASRKLENCETVADECAPSADGRWPSRSTPRNGTRSTP